jgi:hypothetical protein
MRQRSYWSGVAGWYATQRDWTIDLMAFALNIFHTVLSCLGFGMLGVVVSARIFGPRR